MTENPSSPFGWPQWTWWQRLLAGTVIAVIPAYWVWQLFPMDSLYETTALVQVAYMQPRLFPDRPDNMRSPEPPYEWYRRTQMELMKSELMRKKVISRPMVYYWIDHQISNQREVVDRSTWLETHLQIVAVPETTILKFSLQGAMQDTLDDALNDVVAAYVEELVKLEPNHRVKGLVELQKMLFAKVEEVRRARNQLSKMHFVSNGKETVSLGGLEEQRIIQHLEDYCDRLRTEILDEKLELDAPPRISLLQKADPARPAAPKRRLPLALGVGAATLLVTQIFLPRRRPRQASTAA